MECIQKHNRSPDRLKLEVTERVILQDMDYMKYVMNKMINTGIGFYLDDFGAGYSNLVSVLEFPFECVKLDKSLLKGFPGNQDSELLIAMKADCIQGCYYSYPLSEEKFASGIFRGTNS